MIFFIKAKFPSLFFLAEKKSIDGWNVYIEYHKMNRYEIIKINAVVCFFQCCLFHNFQKNLHSHLPKWMDRNHSLWASNATVSGFVLVSERAPWEKHFAWVQDVQRSWPSISLWCTRFETVWLNIHHPFIHPSHPPLGHAVVLAKKPRLPFHWTLPPVHPGGPWG